MSIVSKLNLRSKTRWQDRERGEALVILDVDPDLAKEILQARPETQRAVRKRNVAKIRRAMESGRFLWSGNPIVMTTGGDLIDGQHRLSAAALAGFTLTNQVVSFVSNTNTFLTIDQNLVRGRGDQVRAARESGDEIGLSNAAQAAIVYEHPRVNFNNNSKADLSTSEEATLVIESNLRGIASALSRTKVSPTGPMIAAALRCAAASPSAAEEFFTHAFSNHHVIGGEYSNALQIMSTRMMKERPAGLNGKSLREIALYIRAFADWYAGSNAADQQFYRQADILSRDDLAALTPHKRAIRVVQGQLSEAMA